MAEKSGFKVAIFTLAAISGIYILAFFYGGKLGKLIKGKISSGSIEKVTIGDKVCFQGFDNNLCFKIQIANTDEKRKKGLMFVKKLPIEEGMLFSYKQEGFYNFWMKNTFIPLDMIWIDKNKKIIDIQTAQPCKTKQCPSYIPKGRAQYILEVNAGMMRKYGIEIRTELDF